MKQKFLILLSFLVLMPICIKAQEAPQHRVVYLWDVTYSTHGGRLGSGHKIVTVANQPMEIVDYNSKYDIYDRLVDALIACINQQNPESEIIVVPFNEKVLAIWKAKGTKEGKDYLTKAIQTFYNKDQKNTNIYEAFEYAKTNLFTPKAKYWSDLFVLTDGGHTDSDPNIPSRAKFHEMLRQWCDFAEPNNVHGYYFLLTDLVYKQDPKLKEILEESSCITPLMGIPEGGFTPPTNQFTIKGDQLVNLKDQFQQSIKLSVVLNDVERPIQGTEKVHVYTSSNPYFELDETITIDGKATIEVTPKAKMSLAELQHNMPTDKNTIIVLNFDQEKKETPVNELVNKSCELRYVNKPQKTLTISIKQ